MSKKISRVELIKSLGDESDLGIVSIDNIRIFDEDEEEILDNDFITDYNHNSTIFSIKKMILKNIIKLLQRLLIN